MIKEKKINYYNKLMTTLANNRESKSIDELNKT